MSRQKINRVSAIAPIVMSLLAFCIVLAVVATGWERRETDEGTAAHMFQLLIVLQVPFILGFMATANWQRFMEAARPMAFQVGALALALGSIAYFKL
jgi:hypothetical protein